MKALLVVELLAACGCTLGGIHFWRDDFLARDPTTASEVDRERSRADDRPRAPVGGSHREPAADERTPLGSTTAHGERVAPITTKGGSLEEATAAEPGTETSGPGQVHPRPRAPRSAIAAIPTIAGAGATAPRIPEVLARAALRLVGLDQAAEQTWVAAINQPTLSSDARSNLIEDLNEDGFPDPSHITAADLPLILARLRIIERLAPRAMDDVNAAAFQEAYKDLINMLLELAGAD
jgi:hypothetical protein